MGTPRRVLVDLFPCNRREQFPELGRQGILSLILFLAPLQGGQGRRSERVGQVNLANGRHEGNDFDPVSLPEVVFGNRTSSHSTWGPLNHIDRR